MLDVEEQAITPHSPWILISHLVAMLLASAALVAFGWGSAGFPGQTPTWALLALAGGFEFVAVNRAWKHALPFTGFRIAEQVRPYCVLAGVPAGPVIAAVYVVLFGGVLACVAGLWTAAS